MTKKSFLNKINLFLSFCFGFLKDEESENKNEKWKKLVRITKQNYYKNFLYDYRGTGNWKWSVWFFMNDSLKVEHSRL